MENGTNFIFIFPKLEGAYGRPRWFWTRAPAFPPLVSPRFFFFLREFFSRTLLYERLEQATEALATQACKK